MRASLSTYLYFHYLLITYLYLGICIDILLSVIICISNSGDYALTLFWHVICSYYTEEK